jgi:phage gp16-like protein
LKNLTIFLIGILSIWILHGTLLIKVSKIELSIKEDKKILDELQKELSKKEIEYNTVMDLEKIGNEMKNRKKMAISQGIKFFRIEEK